MIYLKDKLQAVGKTQQQLADELGVSKVVVSEWVHGKKVPKTQRMPLLAAALNCTIDELYVDTTGKEAV